MAVLLSLPLCRECSGYNTSREERSSRLPVRRFRLPAPAPLAGYGPKSRSQELEMNNSPHLDKPLVPLAVALRTMLADTEAKVATATSAEKERLQQRAEMLRERLSRNQQSQPSCVSGLTGRPFPAPRWRGRAAIARFGRAESGSPTATRLSWRAWLLALDVARPGERVWPRSRRQREVWSRFLRSALSRFCGRSMARAGGAGS
jgi:hypothetical protein